MRAPSRPGQKRKYGRQRERPAARVTRPMRMLAESIFESEAERESFLQALIGGAAREKAIIVLRDRAEIRAFPRYRPEKWQPDFVVRTSDEFQPAKHALYESGAYYSLDFSSVFAASAMLALEERPTRILDMCSSPGGKAIFALRAFDPELLVCNETMRKRRGTLIENLIRCQVQCASVSGADSSIWGAKAAGQFDLVIVDAPCSGQSMIAKGREAEGAFDSEMIDMCVGRQRRIVGNAIRCLRPGGALLYMTCTFSRKENEKLIDWALSEHRELSALEVPKLAAFRSPHSSNPCYRLYPHQGYGAGAFTALLQKSPAGDAPVRMERAELPISWTMGEPLPGPKVSVERQELGEDDLIPEGDSV